MKTPKTTQKRFTESRRFFVFMAASACIAASVVFGVMLERDCGRAMRRAAETSPSKRFDAKGLQLVGCTKYSQTAASGQTQSEWMCSWQEDGGKRQYVLLVHELDGASESTPPDPRGVTQ